MTRWAWLGTRLRLRLRTRRDDGVSTIEVVIITPVFLAFILFIVAFGLIVDAQGAVNGAARDAARAGSLKRSLGNANEAAEDLARSQLAGTCSDITFVHDHTDYRPGGMYAIEIRCTLSLNSVSLIGLGNKTVTGRSAAPLDQFRRVD